MSAFGGRPSIHSIMEQIKNKGGFFIGIIVIIAIFGCMVKQGISHGLHVLKIQSGSLQQVLHGNTFLFKYMIPDAGEDICYTTQTNSLNVARVVSGTAVVIIFAVDNSIINHQRQKWNRDVFGKDAIDEVVAFYFDVDEMAELTIECPDEFIK